MYNYIPTRWIGGQTIATADKMNNIENGIFESHGRLDDVDEQFNTKVNYITFYQFGAKGDGVTDDTDAIQKAFSHGGYILNQGGTFKISNGLMINKPTKLDCYNTTIECDESFAEKVCITVNSDNTHINSLHILNKFETKSQTDGKNTGIQIKGNNVRVTNCTVEKFLNSITVDPTGEYYDIVIDNNFIKDNLGVGDGVNNATSVYGEDRGDGIVSWGARCIITNNIVTCKKGQDARIGIHVEGLSNYEINPVEFSNSECIISNNIVYGSFRRGIVNESIDNCVISNNSVYGSKWWCIALAASAKNTIISNNVLEYDYNKSDSTGSAWSPRRVAINLVQGSTTSPKNVIISDNIITVKNYGGGFACQCPTVFAENITLLNNKFISETENDSHCVLAVECNNIRVEGNEIKGFNRGIVTYSNNKIKIANNSICDTTGRAIRLEGANKDVSIINSNYLENCESGIEIINSSNASVIANKINNVTTTALLISNLTNGQIINNTLDGNYTTPYYLGGNNSLFIKDNLGFNLDETVNTQSLSDVNHIINNKYKNRGRMVFCHTNAQIYVAMGSMNVSAWKNMSDGSTITPS